MKKINKDSLYKSIILLFIIIYFSKLIIADEIIKLVHPRNIIYVNISLVILIIVEIYQIFDIFMLSVNKQRINRMSIFLIPIICISIVSFNDYYLNENNLVGKIDDSNCVQVNTKDYMLLVESDFENLDEYLNRNIQLQGFISKDSNMSENEFYLSRFLMTCCVADMQKVNILCNYDGQFNFKEGDWVNLEATIFNKDSNLSLNVKNIYRIDKIKDEYIYP